MKMQNYFNIMCCVQYVCTFFAVVFILRWVILLLFIFLCVKGNVYNSFIGADTKKSIVLGSLHVNTVL